MVAETKAPARFNPREHIIALKSRGGGTSEYLPIAARLAWFRQEHPDADVTIAAHAITPEVAIFHARIALAAGGSAEGWGSETPQDFKDYIEKASSKALGRALLCLGYGTLQAGAELDEGERVADSPAERRGVAPAPPPAPERSVDELAEAMLDWLAKTARSAKQIRYGVERLCGLTDDQVRHEAWLATALALYEDRESRDLIRRVATPLVHQDALDAAWFAVTSPAEEAQEPDGGAVQGIVPNDGPEEVPF